LKSQLVLYPKKTFICCGSGIYVALLSSALPLRRLRNSVNLPHGPKALWHKSWSKTDFSLLKSQLVLYPKLTFICCGSGLYVALSCPVLPLARKRGSLSFSDGPRPLVRSEPIKSPHRFLTFEKPTRPVSKANLHLLRFGALCGPLVPCAAPRPKARVSELLRRSQTLSKK
jgi:hypothetical protein